MQNVIKDLDNDKAMGSDCIHNQMIKIFPYILIQNLVDLCNFCFLQGEIPQIWNCANTILIYKKGKPPNLASSYRPIAVSSCVGRLLERILALRLQTYCIVNKIFSGNQSGFQTNRSCDDIINVLLTKFKRLLSRLITQRHTTPYGIKI